MQQKNVKKEGWFSKKIGGFFGMLCTKQQEPALQSNIPKKSGNKQHTQKNKAAKNKETGKYERRGTLAFHLQSTFIRISRKNIMEEEFLPNQIINFQVEKHLGCRIKNMGTVVLLEGEFTQELINNIHFPVQIKQSVLPHQSNRHDILISNSIPRFRRASIDILIYQTTFTTQKSRQELLQNKNSFDLQTRLKLSYKQVAEILAKINELSECNIPHGIIIASNAINTDELGKRLGVFGREFLFEQERVMKNHELFCIIIYVSKNPLFLKIDDRSIKQLVIDTLEIATQFQKETITDFIAELINTKKSDIYQLLFLSLKQINLNKIDAPKIAYSKLQKHKKSINVSEDSYTSQKSEGNELGNRVGKNIEGFLSKIESFVDDKMMVNKYREKLGYGIQEHNQETPYLQALTPDFHKHGDI